MLKKIVKLGLAGILGMGLALTVPINAAADYPDRSHNTTPVNQTILVHGWISSCDSSFFVESLGDNWVEVKIIMGKDGTIQDSIQKWNKRGYDLKYTKQLSKTVDIDDVAIIENLSKDSNANVHC